MAQELFTCDEVLRNVACAMRLAFPFTLNATRPFYGLAESNEATKRAFSERWRY
jgi:hypothetical protein